MERKRDKEFQEYQRIIASGGDYDKTPKQAFEKDESMRDRYAMKNKKLYDNFEKVNKLIADNLKRQHREIKAQ